MKHALDFALVGGERFSEKEMRQIEIWLPLPFAVARQEQRHRGAHVLF